MLHTTTCIYITFFFATFLPLIIINQSILATHINSEVEELDITTASKFMIFYFIFPSLFTALELQSGSNRPQANAASGNAVITFLLFFFFFSRETQMQSVVFCEALWETMEMVTKHWVEMFDFFFFPLYHSKQNDFES